MIWTTNSTERDILHTQVLLHITGKFAIGKLKSTELSVVEIWLCLNPKDLFTFLDLHWCLLYCSFNTLLWTEKQQCIYLVKSLNSSGRLHVYNQPQDPPLYLTSSTLYWVQMNIYWLENVKLDLCCTVYKR